MPRDTPFAVYAYHTCPDRFEFIYLDGWAHERWPHRLGDVDEPDGRFNPDSKANGARGRIWRAAYEHEMRKRCAH